MARCLLKENSTRVVLSCDKGNEKIYFANIFLFLTACFIQRGQPDLLIMAKYQGEMTPRYFS